MKTNTMRNCAVVLILANVLLVAWVGKWYFITGLQPNAETTSPTVEAVSREGVYRLVLNREVDNADGTVDVLSTVVVLEIGSEAITVNSLD